MRHWILHDQDTIFVILSHPKHRQQSHKPLVSLPSPQNNSTDITNITSLNFFLSFLAAQHNHLQNQEHTTQEKDAYDFDSRDSRFDLHDNLHDFRSPFFRDLFFFDYDRNGDQVD